jgi:hypothetical protein
MTEKAIALAASLRQGRLPYHQWIYQMDAYFG